MNGVPLEPGQSIQNRYELIELVGEGGEARVWKAFDHAIGRLVAVKEVTGRLGDSASALREARAVARLSHPNIITLYDVIEGEPPLLIMEFVEGVSLREVLELDHTLDLPVAVSIFAQAALAVEYAHNHGVLHLDIKPENILILPTGKVKLADFGVARHLLEESPSSAIKGTLAYCAPEVLSGRLTEKADVFSLAVVLYEMLTGENPFYAPTARAVAEKLREFRPFPPSEVNPSLPAEIDPVVLKGLEKSPPRRYESVLRFRLKVEPFADGRAFEEHVASLFEQEVARERRWPRFWPISLPGAGARVRAAAAAGLYFAAGSYLLETGVFAEASLALVAAACAAVAFVNPAWGAAASTLMLAALLFLRSFPLGSVALALALVATLSFTRLSKRGAAGLLVPASSALGLEAFVASLVAARLSLRDALSFAATACAGVATYALLLASSAHTPVWGLVERHLDLRPTVSFTEVVNGLRTPSLVVALTTVATATGMSWLAARLVADNLLAALAALAATAIALAAAGPLAGVPEPSLDAALRRLAISLFATLTLLVGRCARRALLERRREREESSGGLR